MRFGEKLMALRAQRKESREALSAALGIGRSTIQRWEDGDESSEVKNLGRTPAPSPRAADLLAIARHYGVSSEYLINDDVSDPGQVTVLLSSREGECLERCRRIGVDRAAALLQFILDIGYRLSAKVLADALLAADPGRHRQEEGHGVVVRGREGHPGGADADQHAPGKAPRKPRK